MRKLKPSFVANIKQRTGLFLVGLLLVLSTYFLSQSSASFLSQSSESIPVTQTNYIHKLERGINLSHWFFQPTDGYTQTHLDTWITEADFSFLAEETKVTHVRLPIDPVFLQQKEAPYQINQENFIYIDRALNWAEKYRLGIIIDLHPDEELDLKAGTSSQAYQNLEQLWLEIARRYQNQPQNVIFELLNEPNVKNPYIWHEITQELSQAIRQIDQKHTLIVAAPGLSGPSEIADLVPISDSNVIYTFHFYDPLVFTHQQAFWDPVLSKLRDVPYPYEALRLEASQQKVSDPKALEELIWYEKDRYDKQKLLESLQAALQFRDRHKVQIYCGEFGVYQLAPTLDKYSWLQDVTQLLSQEDIGYALWEYHGSFGIIGEKTERVDQETLRAAGLYLGVS